MNKPLYANDTKLLGVQPILTFGEFKDRKRREMRDYASLRWAYDA